MKQGLHQQSKVRWQQNPKKEIQRLYCLLMKPAHFTSYLKIRGEALTRFDKHFVYIHTHTSSGRLRVLIHIEIGKHAYIVKEKGDEEEYYL